MIGVDKFVQAAHYTPNRTGSPRLWVEHDMEAPERATIAEDVAAYFASGRVRASAHANVDVDSIVGSVRWADVAWAAPGSNHDGLQIEHAGYARQIRAEWLDPYGVAMLERSARLFVEVGFLIYKIPPKVLTVDEVRDGAPGICGHWDVSKAFGRSDHWDPGHHFPYDYLLERVHAIIDGTAGIGTPAPEVPPPAPPPAPVGDPVVSRRRSPSHPLVDDVQTMLQTWRAAAGRPPITIDGIFGPQTEAAVLDFQRNAVDPETRQPLAVDGIVGPVTLRALRFAAYVIAAGREIPARPPTAVAPDWPDGLLVRRGSHGVHVSRVQSRLRDRGWKISVDGTFGPATESTVKAFQAEKGLAVDGIVGPATWAALWTAPVT